ncbi:uncharacterized protein LOC120869215 isoform X2 [Oryx dammah]|uniref:uncharacterized protein LOC120869215 isoform X2 n=1 Tax=Oryx dammah TaxID=59534 RepID=UPI001A9BE5FC|nr:uncharacterized protein LOC120869215 isoform X2 [Oryx dammah]
MRRPEVSQGGSCGAGVNRTRARGPRSHPITSDSNVSSPEAACLLPDKYLRDLRDLGQYLSVICSVPGGCLVLSSCGTIAQPERTGQTHPSEVVWPITSWRIRERLLWASQPGERWRRVHCVQRRHGSCRVRSILDRTVLEVVLGLITDKQTEEGCCCMTTARPPSPVASAQYGRTWPHVTRSGAWLRPETLGHWDS